MFRNEERKKCARSIHGECMSKVTTPNKISRIINWECSNEGDVSGCPGDQLRDISKLGRDQIFGEDGMVLLKSLYGRRVSFLVSGKGRL